jgi:DNA-binding transcriptional MocR family regulator
MPRFRETIPIDDYVLDVLLRDLVGHDHQPASFIVYLHLYSRAARRRWRPVTGSLRELADATGLSKSTTQLALAWLRYRKLIQTETDGPTAQPRHRIVRHWRPAKGVQRAR